MNRQFILFGILRTVQKLYKSICKRALTGQWNSTLHHTYKSGLYANSNKIRQLVLSESWNSAYSLIQIRSGSWSYLKVETLHTVGRVPFVNCRQFMYLVISLLVLRAGYGIWLYQFLIIAYLFTYGLVYGKRDTMSLNSHVVWIDFTIKWTNYRQR